nr:putative ribonuclease H-like domain-containing protein [Tanacetum cinerariifolium]
MHDPREPHLVVLKKILRYVRGYCVFLGDNLLSWSSKRQHTISRSSAKAEYRSVASVVAETARIQNILLELYSLLHATCNFGVTHAATFFVLHPQDKNIIAIGKGYKAVHFEANIVVVSIAGTSSTEQPLLKDKSKCNKTAKDLWDALARHMLGSEYVINDLKKCGELKDNCELNFKFLNNLQPMWKQYATMMRQNKNLMDINIDALYNILNQNQGDVTDVMGLKKKLLWLLIEQSFTLNQQKQLKNIIRFSVCQQEIRKEGHFAKDYKNVKVKDYEYYKTKILIAKKDKDEQVLLVEDHAWMESSSDLDQEINTNMVFMAQIEKVLSDSDDSSSFADDKISEVSYYLSESESESEYETSEYYDNTTTYAVDHNDSKGIDKLIRKFNKKIAKCLKRIEKANQQNKDFENQNKDLQDKYDVLKNQAINFEMKNNELNEQLKVLIEKNDDFLAQTNMLKDQVQIKHVVIDTYVECQEKYAKLEAERYEYMIRYSAYFDNDKQRRKQIVDQEVFKAKDLRPTLYDERVINLGYTPMFLTHSDKALKIEKFKRARENKIEFAYDYGNVKASYVNEKINFSDDYFQEIINPDYEKIDSPFQQTSSLKPYVLTVILEKIIIDLEDEVVSLLENEKENLKTIESLKSKDVETGVESSEKVVSKTENKSENDCQAIEKVCNSKENPNVIAPGMFKLRVSQSVSPISVTKTSCASNGVENLSLDHRFGMFKAYIGNRALLTNFVEKFLGTVRSKNNDFALIAGYGDVVIGSMTIKKVYYVKGLGHNLFSVGQFCDKGLKVAFRKSACFVRKEDGVDLLTGDRSSNLYTIALNEVASNSLTCLLAKAFSSQSWLWHQRLLHLNFATINNLVKNNLVQGLPKMKFEKDHLCSACEQGKIHQKHHKSKTDFASNKPLYLLHMDLCGPMRLESINGKRYVLVIIDDYSRYTWRVRTNNGTEFKNKTLAKFFDEVGISQQFSAARTPQHNGVVERRNRTLVEAARTMPTLQTYHCFFELKLVTTVNF